MPDEVKQKNKGDSHECKYSVTYRDDGHYILLEVQGCLDATIGRIIIQETVNKALENSCDRFLCDIRSTQLNESKSNLFDLAWNLDALGVQNTFKVATVYTQDRDGHMFFERTAKSRGLSHFRYFTNMDEAMRWIDVFS